MDLIEIRLIGVHWIHLAQDRFNASSCGQSNEPSGSSKEEELLDWLGVTVGFSRRFLVSTFSRV
jgi:hypothetical protein